MPAVLWICYEMASIIEVGGQWRAPVRRRRHKAQTRTFENKAVAERWARKIERKIDIGKYHDNGEAKRTTLQDLIDRLKLERPNKIGRSHGYALDQLERRLGNKQLPSITSDRLIRYARERNCKPSTWAPELSYLVSMLRIARAVWKLPIGGDPVGDAREALKMLGYQLKSHERSRRPTANEIDALAYHFNAKTRQRIPMDKIIPFAIATTMGAEEITRLVWSDLDESARTVIIRDRKDPRDKQDNDQEAPLLRDAWAIVKSMPHTDARIFPFNSRTFSSIFPRACRVVEPTIRDLRFHDLRHEGISRLFEAGYVIPEVAIFSGHKDWKMLERYTHIKAKSLHRGRSKSRHGSPL